MGFYAKRGGFLKSKEYVHKRKKDTNKNLSLQSACSFYYSRLLNWIVIVSDLVKDTITSAY